jgi:methionine synthase II (cobalamin-independent)
MASAVVMEDLRQMRVDQVGSLCAPSRLQHIFDDYKRGKVSEEELDRAKDEAIRGVIRKQEAIGFPVRCRAAIPMCWGDCSGRE